MKVKKNYDGVKFNHMTVICDFESLTKDRKVWCRCDCGVEKAVMIQKLKNGTTKSCGKCKYSPNTKHGMTGTSFYLIWENIINRTKDLNNINYGGRGITVCERWKKFLNFKEDMYPSYESHLTIERIDVNKGYFKENCIWETQVVQGHNRRKYRGNCTSYGVHYCERDGLFICSITKNKKNYRFYGKNEEICKIAYDNASSLLYGDRPNKTNEVVDDLFLRIKKELTSKDFITDEIDKMFDTPDKALYNITY
jgi:hypothetical protein